MKYNKKSFGQKWIVVGIGITMGVLFLSARLGFFVSYAFVRSMNIGTDAVPLSGTGSMYPTFPKGISTNSADLAKELVSTPRMQRYPTGFSMFGKRFFDYQLSRGDIVSFVNDKTKSMTQRDTGISMGFVKRLIALPGDQLEIRDGLVYLNGYPQKEQYIARSRSTFGGSSLHECTRYVVPAETVVVLGDNRKGSSDSRHELGYVRIADITHVIPWSTQQGEYDTQWRNTEHDLIETAKIHLDQDAYLQLLNEKRKQAGVSALRYQAKLERSANKRGQVMLQFNDFSFAATKSGITLKKVLREVGYTNIVTGEAPTQGYYEAEELLENQFAFPESKKFLLDPDYQDIGISEVQGEINGCPTQVIVQHFGGYKPPNYSQKDIQAWKDILDRLVAIEPSWQGLRNYPEYYEKHKTEAERIITVINTRIANIRLIVAKMEANQWLSETEMQMAKDDQALANEQSELAEALNTQ